ncbi:matrixin family metalloprotease [Streptomyces sp. KR80]|uniref:matrixin family metalloprotease n=1 Tax=Streptomyces sp. KR80 TaxID=3457426 RepID=UPI003FD33BF9
MKKKNVRRAIRSRVLMMAGVGVLGLGLAVPAAQAAPAEAPGKAPTAASSTAENAESGDVYAVKRRANGVTSVTVYRPAPGVTSTELASRLRAAGVAGVQTNATPASTKAVSPAALPCSYGSARTLECSPVRWAHNGYSDPQVYFLDHTSAAWPMTAVVPKWHESVGIDSYYRWYTGGCPGGGRHCVHAYSGNYGATGWTGLTNYSYNSSRYLVDGSVSMKLNDHYGGSAAEHRNTACHEAGHVLGLGHSTSTTSCMYGSRTSQQYPNSHDFALLPRIYP